MEDTCVENESTKRDEALLWRAFRDGSEPAFERIYADHIKSLYQYGSKLTCDKQLLMDCIHDVFVDLFNSRSRLADTDNIRFYLIKSLKRKLIRMMQKDIRYQSLDKQNLPFLVTYSHEEVMMQGEASDNRLRRLANALEKLTPRQREAIYLRYKNELDYQEIALIMEMNYQSVRNIVFRAIEKLREVLIDKSSMDLPDRELKKGYRFSFCSFIFF